MSEEDHHHNDMVAIEVELEEDHLEELEKLAGEYSESLDQDWDVSALVRVAVGDLLNKLGRLV